MNTWVRVITAGWIGWSGTIGCSPQEGAPDADSESGAVVGSTSAVPSDESSSSGPDDPASSGSDSGTTGPVGTSEPGSDDGGPQLPGCSPEALELIDLVNAYRMENGLPAVPASPSMCAVGQAHAEDLELHEPHMASIDCNMHSWSDQGDWTPCCYTPDHAQAECMWNKPMEIAGYPGVGFENAAGSTAELSPEEALEVWQWSSDHDALMLETGPWAEFDWKAMGAGLSGGYGVLWVGTEPDPAG